MITISRRVVVTGLASPPFATDVLGSHRLALAQTGVETVSVKTPSGRTVSGVLAIPAKLPAPGLLQTQGASGLIDVTKSFAVAGFAQEAIPNSN